MPLSLPIRSQLLAMLFLLLASLTPGTSARAQTIDSLRAAVPRPLVDLDSLPLPKGKDLKIGLVLSGGGAKGYARIGALQVLEEAGIRVDYIGGTSMGAIVGGLYAAGYSANQLEKMLRETDIMSELQDVIERERRTIYEKLYEERYLLGIDLEDFSVQIPAALSDGQRIHDLFAHWTARVGHIRDYDQLPIPFLAVGTDLETGEAVVLENGMLAEAMRASAALPGVLSPYEIDGKLLTDGGVSNNYPAEEVRAKGMDYLIGISVEEDPLKSSEIRSIGDLMLQIAFFQANRRNIDQYAATELDIKPNLKGYSVLSFDAIDTLISAGRIAARAALPALRELAARQDPGALRPPRYDDLPEGLNIGQIVVRGNKELSERQVLSFFGEDALPGRISWDDYREAILNLFATGRYEKINYRWERTGGPNEEVRLFLYLERQPEFGQRVRLGLHYDQVYRSNFLLNLTRNDVLVDNSFVSLDIIGGNRFRFNLDYRINRLDGSAFGMRARRHYADVDFELEQPMRTPANGLTFDQADFRFSDLSAELYWDVRQTTNSFTGVAAEFKYYRTTSDHVAAVDTAGLFRLSDDLYFVPRAYLLYDKLDAPYFALRGFRIRANARLIRNLTGENVEEVDRWATNGDVEFLGVLPITERLSFGLEVMGGGFLDAELLPYRYYLGSNNQNLMNNFKPFVGLELGEASGSRLALADVFIRARTFSSQFLNLGLRAARIGNPEGLPTSVARNSLLAGYVGYGLASPLGPIEVTYAYGNEGSAFYFNLGYWF